MIVNKERSLVSLWERNDRNPSVDDLINLSIYFKVSIDDLVKRDLEIEEQKQEGLFPEGYDTTPIGLGIGAAGITGAIGAVVIDSMMPKSAKKQQPKYEIDDDDINDYRDFEIADEAEEKPIVSLKIDPSMTSYQASRNHESMKKFYNDEEER